MAATELEDLSGPQKAAIMMLSMGDDRASRMFGMMDDEEIRELSTHMVNLGTISSEVIEALLREFVEMMSQTGAVSGTFESTERLLAKTLGEDRVKGLMEELRGPAGRTLWDKLGNVDEELLATYFRVFHAPIELFPPQDRPQAVSFSEYRHTAAARRSSWTRRRML